MGIRDLYISENENSENFQEIMLAAEKFKKKYILKPLGVLATIIMEGNEINKHFEIYPMDNCKIENVSPINLDSSHIENLLLNTEEVVVLRIDNNLYHVRKDNLYFKN